MTKRRVVCLTGILLLMSRTVGCSSSADERLVHLSQESVKRQAEQNQTIAKQSREIAQASRELVEADAKARREIVQLQTELQKDAQADRRNLDRQHEELETERKQIAQARHREPIVAAAIEDAAILLACLLPLLLAWFVIRAIRQDPDEAALGELLVHEFVTEQPLLLPSNVSCPQMIEHQAGPLAPKPPAVDPES